jgi:hypothetical protein
VLCTIGEVNFFFGPTQRPHLKFDELSRLIGVSKSALAIRARFIMNLLRIMPAEAAYRRHEQLVQDPQNRIVEKATRGTGRRTPAMKQPFLGLWRIVEMELWERDDVDMLRPAHIRFNRDGTGEFQFMTVQGEMDCRFGERDGRPIVEFSW